MLVGDYVISKNDGDRHYVSARCLLRLYGLNAEECYLVDPRNYTLGSNSFLIGDLIVLTPRYDGNYTI